MTMWAMLLVSLLAATQVPVAPRQVSFETADGARISADVYGKGADAVVLAHGAAFNKGSWKALAEVLDRQGHLVVAIDFRGYGASTQGREDQALYQDVLAAVRYARSQGATSVGVLGASMGGGASARAAVAARAGEIDRLMLLAGVAIDHPESMKAGRFLYVASRDEPMAPSVAKQFERAPEPKRMEWLEGSAHAQHVFKSDQAARLTALVLEFFAPASRPR